MAAATRHEPLYWCKMPFPIEFKTASRDFDQLLTALRDQCLLQTQHQAYQVLWAVLHVFRSHLPVQDVLSFGDALPPLVRAVLVEDWQPPSVVPPFPRRQQLQAEVMAIRPDHNLSPDSAIPDLAKVLRRFVDQRGFDAVLARLPPEARDFWSIEEAAG